MNIEHKLEPIEHWIVDGKAYRLATEKDVGKEVLLDDVGVETAFGDPHLRILYSVLDRGKFRFLSPNNIGWKYAYVQDDSLLPQVTEQPEPTPPKPIDWTKPVRTKCTKRPVRIVCTDGPGDYPVVGFVGARTDPHQWTLDGNWLVGDVHENDLENAPQRIQREYWVNVYDGSMSTGHNTKHDADLWASPERRACVKITIDCEEGEGL